MVLSKYLDLHFIGKRGKEVSTNITEKETHAYLFRKAVLALMPESEFQPHTVPRQRERSLSSLCSEISLPNHP